MVRSSALLLLSLLLPAVAHAQDPQAAANIAKARAALQPVAWLAGTWEGDAQVAMGPNNAMKVRQSEDVVWGAGGTVLIIRGTGRDPSTGAINFEAAATVWFDADAQKLRMRTFRDGRTIEPDIEARTDTIIWGFAVTGGRIRYTITREDDGWHEVGDFIREGGQPFRTIEMRLSRTGR